MSELLADALARDWYHTIELAPGQATRGVVDLRRVAPRLLPDSLAGKRALDVGTFDGFWAFSLEQRGAEEVLAADLDSFDDVEIPPLNRERVIAEAGDTKPGDRFPIAREILGSKVQRIVSSIYDLSLEKTGGPLDVAVIGNLLLHLRDPVGGLEAVHSVLKPGGTLYLCEQVSVIHTILRPRNAAASFQSRATDFNWWMGNAACLRDWLVLSGYTDVRRKFFTRPPNVGGHRRWHAAFEASRA